MALFRNYEKPGPGVEKDTPRKKGIARFFEVLWRDFGGIVKLNLLLFACPLPAAVLLVCSLWFADWFWLFLLAALAASLLVGPAVSATLFCLSKMLRDEPGYLWYDFKKAFRQNARQMMLPGVVCMLLVAVQLYAVFLFLFLPEVVGMLPMVLLLLSILLFWMVAPYLFLQAAYLHLGLGALLKNSLLLAFGNAPRSLLGAALWLVPAVLQLWFFPYALPATLFIGYALPLLMQLMCIWPPVDKAFKLEETLRAREEEAYTEPTE